MLSPPVDPMMNAVLWSRTSKEIPVPNTQSSLSKEYDLAVVGAGFCGLSIALHAAIRGMSVVLMEAGKVGCGASGRNGGFAVPQFPGAITPSLVQGLLGRKKGNKLCEIVSQGPSFAFDQIEKYQIKCDAEQNGWVQPAHSQKSLKKVRKVYEEWKAFGAPVEWLDQDELAARLGTSFYLGGWLGPSGFTVNPYALCLGLARAATSRGVHLLQGCRVTTIERAGNLISLRGETADVKARKVVIATNGYTGDLFPRLQRSVIPIRLFHTFTKSLSKEQQASVLPSRLCFTDLRKAGGFCRYDAEGRIVSGGAVFAFGKKESAGIRHATHRVQTYFPKIAFPEIETYWEGYCALTPTYLPSVQHVERDIYALIGFSTRGVSLAQNLGREFAAYLNEEIPRDELPVEVGPTTEIPWQPAKTVLGSLAFPVFKAADRFGLT